MNREKVKRVEAQIAPSRIVCIWFDEDMGQVERGLYCGNVDANIPPSECPACQGGECMQSSQFIHVVIEEASNED